MHVLIPVNRLDRAKGRLAALLDAEERASLARVTLSTVVHACREAGFEVTVLTADPAVRDAIPGPVEVIDEDPRLSGLNEQLERGVRMFATAARLQGEPFGLLILHADLPLATADALRAFVRSAPPAPSVTMVESPDGGTNAMLLCPPGRFALAYGRGSFAKHERAARAAGMAVARVQSPELSLDLDTPADIDELLATEAGRQSPAGILLANHAFLSSRATGSDPGPPP